jgi:hypothetical protein
VLGLAACRQTPDLPGATPLSCTGPSETRTLRIDRIDVPFDASAALETGIDVDGDETSDNQNAAVLGALAAALPGVGDAAPARIQARVDSDTIWLIGIAQCDGNARVTLSRGELDGTSVRIVEEGAVPAAGVATDRHVAASQGIGLLPLGAIVDLSDTGLDDWHPTYPTTIALDLATGEAVGTIAGAIAPDYRPVFEDGILPTMQARLEGGDTTWAPDDNEDGVITRDELERDDVFEILMLPDVDVGGDALDPPATPDTDGEPESLSFGVGFHAVDVVVE